MKDITGKDLQVGDTVAYNQEGYTFKLAVGKVIGFTEQKVRVQPVELANDFGIKNSVHKPVLKFPQQLSKVINT